MTSAATALAICAGSGPLRAVGVPKLQKMPALRAVLVLSLVGAAMSQYKPFYAGSGWSYPGPLPQFTSDDGLDNRVGQAPTSTLSPEEDVASRVSAWPADRQPFWFVNRGQIQEHIGRPQPQPQPQTQAPSTQTPQALQTQTQAQTQQPLGTRTQTPTQTQTQQPLETQTQRLQPVQTLPQRRTFQSSFSRQ